MSLLGASRQLGGSTLKRWAVKHVQAISQLHHHTFHAPRVYSQRLQSIFGVRFSSEPAQIGTTTTTSIEESGRQTESRSRRNQKWKTNRDRKLHRRVFNEQEQTENEQFKQTFTLENDDDMFGNLRRRKEQRQLSTPVESDIQTNSSSTIGETHRTPAIRHFKENMTEGHKYKPSSGRNMTVGRRDSSSDTFGTLAEDDLADRIEESLKTTIGSHEERFSDDEDEKESKQVRLSAVNRRHVPEWYGRRILKLGKRGQVREAIAVFEEWMLKEDRVMPNSYVFTCLITVVGHAGYTKKAFSLFNKMKQMGIQPKPATYTALFNACANSPWKSDGLQKADKLLQLMEEKDVDPTFITGKAMVKAFAMCGDLRRAFSLVDEMSQVYRPDSEVFSFLLMACISDKETGLRYAIQVWRLMRQMRIKADLPLYNLLLRCVRDCGVGDTQTFTALLTGQTASPQSMGKQETAALTPGSQTETNLSDLKGMEQTLVACDTKSTTNTNVVDTEREAPQSVINDQLNCSDNQNQKRLQVGNENQLQISDECSLDTNELTDEDSHLQRCQSQSAVTPQSTSVTIPDILSSSSLDCRIVSVSDLSAKHQRLSLLGGVEGVLDRMARDQAQPNLITFTQLISVANPTVEAEEHLLQTMESLNVRPDIGLINTLMHKRCMRRDFDAAKSVGGILTEYGLTANQMTYGILAMTCTTRQDAMQLLEDMEKADMEVSMEILGTLMFASGMKFAYKLWILRQAQQLDLPPNAKFLQNVEKSLALVRQRMVHLEKQGQPDHHFLSPAFQASVETFTQHYESWLKQTRVQVPPHPWASFRSPPSDRKDAVSV